MSEDDERPARPLEEVLAEFFDDPIPQEVLTACEELFTWRTIDAELATLDADVAVDEMAAGVRSLSATASLSFHSDDLRIEIDYDPDTELISGQVFPAGPASVTVARPHDPSITVDATSHGTFEIGGSLSGPLQIVVEAGGRTARTDWIVLRSVDD